MKRTTKSPSMNRVKHGRVRAAEDSPRDLLLRVPKVELHVHLDGSLRVQTIIELADEQGIPLPARDPARLARYVQVSPECRSLTEFLGTFRFIYPLIRRDRALERIAYEQCREAARQRIVYFETRYAPVLLAWRRLSMRDSVDAVLEGLRRGCRDFGVEARLILCCYRPKHPDSSLETVRLAAKYLDRGVCGVDLAGDEILFPGEPHREAFRLARRRDVPVTIHAGEAAGAHSIREAIETLGARRIGHGVHLRDDRELLRKFSGEEIPLEMCLTSNLQTQVVADIRDHPFGKFFRDGLNVSLNSDDPGVSNTDLTAEYRLAADAFGLRLADFERMVERAAEAAFLPRREKKALVGRVKEGFAPFRARRDRKRDRGGGP